ncbi:MAG: glycosyltransferase family 39 protein [Jaaginema sp. PMC 1079.18]|nr:glycosyltransferase family 39 protein [Jaaginema sp. PMC 1080.18]MEC4850519.1 glycosyltransferase family 39 protein [Jaaginema sp. PMC 1079.18]MEC4864776.1 glycosyltransferase family 39 protein [Jaaginema sp. PMC 1078.18]
MQSSKLKSRVSATPVSRQKTVSVPWLWLWTIIGAGLRFTNLTAKPPWTDEFATLTFSLGNSYLPIPWDEPITLRELLVPLQTNLGGSLQDVFTNIITEDNHPPLFFGLLHLWLKLFPQDEYISLWAARSLSAFLGVLAIPAIYFLARAIFRSNAIAQGCAILMALSPYSIYLAQEARHYTLGVLFVILSLFCLFKAIQYLGIGTKIPISLMVFWAVVNGLGFLNHYFFVLTLGSMAIALLGFIITILGRGKSHYFWQNLGRLSIAGILTGAVIIIWRFGVLPSDYGSTMTNWIQNNNSSILEIISPIFQLGAAIVPMSFLLPVESPWLPLAIVSGAIMIFYVLWLIPVVNWGIKVRLRQPHTRLAIQVSLSFIVSAIAIFFLITYIGGIDITRGARYSFVYFPAVILILGATLAACWQRDRLLFQYQPQKQKRQRSSFFAPLYRHGKIMAIAIVIMGFASAITVINNLGYQKYYRPDLFRPILEKSPASTVLIATTHETLVQTGEMMGIAWLLKDRPKADNTHFLLAHQPQKDSPVATKTLQKAIQKMPRSLDLWLVNFYAPVKLDDCALDPQTFPGIDGYNYQLYHCPEVANIRAQDREE